MRNRHLHKLPGLLGVLAPGLGITFELPFRTPEGKPGTVTAFVIMQPGQGGPPTYDVHAVTGEWLGEGDSIPEAINEAQKQRALREWEARGLCN